MDRRAAAGAMRHPRAVAVLLLLLAVLAHGFPQRQRPVARERPGLAKLGSLPTDATGEGTERLERFHEIFQGKFDNRAQAIGDQEAGRGWDGPDGHEHITCELRTVDACAGLESDTMIVATYGYVRETGPEVFRYRWYTVAAEKGRDGDVTLRMRVHRLQPWAEAVMARAGYGISPPALAEEGGGRVAWEYLPACDVLWTRALLDDGGEDFRGELAAGECLVPSQRDPTRMLRVTDDLRVSAGRLHINDQVQDAESGQVLYGKNDPYILQRQP